MPPPAKVLAVAAVISTVDVLGVTVWLAAAGVLHAVAPASRIVHVPVPMLVTRVVAPAPAVKLPVVTFLLFASKVPAVNVRARLAAIVNASASWSVAPAFNFLIGKSRVRPFDVITCVPETPFEYSVEAPDAHVMVGENVILPPTYRSLLLIDPENPVKLRLPITHDDDVSQIAVPDPADTLIFIAANALDPEKVTVPLEIAAAKLIVGVSTSVRLVALVVSHTLPLVPVR